MGAAPRRPRRLAQLLSEEGGQVFLLNLLFAFALLALLVGLLSQSGSVSRLADTVQMEAAAEAGDLAALATACATGSPQTGVITYPGGLALTVRYGADLETSPAGDSLLVTQAAATNPADGVTVDGTTPNAEELSLPWPQPGGAGSHVPAGPAYGWFRKHFGDRCPSGSPANNGQGQGQGGGGDQAAKGP